VQFAQDDAVLLLAVVVFDAGGLFELGVGGLLGVGGEEFAGV
jgi:hypothetical protein